VHSLGAPLKGFTYSCQPDDNPPSTHPSISDPTLSSSHYGCPIFAQGQLHGRFTFESQRFVDTRLPFGCRSSPFLFNLYAEAFYWILESNGIPLSHYLDGFFGCSANPLEALAAFNSLASHLGISVQARKLESGTKLEILGILIDSANGMASITPERRVKLLALLNNTLSRDTASAFELLAIAGHLVSVCRICPPGRAFLRRIYDASHDLQPKENSTLGEAGLALVEGCSPRLGRYTPHPP